MPDAPDLNALLQQAQAMQQKVVEAQERAKQKTVEGSAGGGLVTVVVNGALEVKSLKIDPQAPGIPADPKDVALLEDLVAAAINQALAKAQEMMAAEMQSAASGLNIPGLF